MVLIVRQRGFSVPILSCDRDTPVSYKFSGRMCVCWGAYFRPPEEFLVGDIRDVSILRAGRDSFIHLGSRSTQLLPWYLVHAQWRFDELLDEAPPAESFRKCCLSSLFPKVKVKVSQLYLTLCN